MTMGATLWKKIELWDQTALFHVNQVWQNKFFDSIMPWLREAHVWLPLYLFFIVLAIYNFGKKGFYWVLFLIATIALTDQVSSHLIKPWVGRLRPCNDPLMLQYLHLRVSHCSGGFSFPSSHAANHFGIAMFIVSTLIAFTGNKIKWLFAWAAAICYAQMYVGVHYPIDVVCGSLVGVGGGWVTASIFRHFVKLPLLNELPAANVVQPKHL